ncbi:MAG: GntR family transcriptional regulator [Pseudomonadota bacterium]
MNFDAYLADFPQPSPTAAESVSKILRQAILEGALRGGQTLRQEELAKKFGVSRLPVREALLKLEGEGLVETQPRRGVVVTSLTAEDFEEILQMRLALESLALTLAAPRFTPEDTRAAGEILLRGREGIDAVGAPDLGREFESRWGDLNWEFHRRLYQPAAKPRLLATIENLHKLFARHLRVRMAGQPEQAAATPVADYTSPQEARAASLQGWAQVLDEHRLMLEACDRHDAEAACAVLRGHISGHGAELVHRLRAAT